MGIYEVEVKMEGTVKWYNFKKGYGFVEGEDGTDYFVHYSALDQGTFLRENDKVEFEPADSEKGKQAQNVKLIQKGSDRTDLPPEEEAGADVSEEAPAEEGAEAPAEEKAEAPAEEPKKEKKKEAEEAPAEDSEDF